MKKEKFKNITDIALTVPEVGVIGPGETVELPETFHNVNFKKVEAGKPEPEKILSNKEKTK